MTTRKTARSFALPSISYRVWKVWRRNFDVFMKTAGVNFLPSIIEPILYLLAFGFGLGSLVASIGGVSYIRYIAPALVAIAIMQGSFFECTYSSFVRMYYQKTFDAIIATPISVEEVIAGELLWGATRAFFNSTAVLVVVAVFGLISTPLFVLVPLLAFFGGLMFASLGMCFTAVAPNIDSFNYPIFLLITPMFLLSGTFFPLPLAVQPVSLALPLTHVVNITRFLVIGKTSEFIVLGIIWIAAAGLVFFILSINLMKRRLIK
jgi:lipooligosaccharide transport system permease protein